MESEPLERRMQRAAQNQALCREVNERIEALSDQFAVEVARRDFVCECANEECTEKVAMTVAEYEAIRSNANLFVVMPRPEHVFEDVEVIVDQFDGYWTVSKIGVGATVAERLDPRSRR